MPSNWLSRSYDDHNGRKTSTCGDELVENNNFPYAATTMDPGTSGLMPKVSLPRCSVTSPDIPGNTNHLLWFYISAYDHKTKKWIVDYSGPAYLFVEEENEGEVLRVQQKENCYQSIPSVDELQIGSEVCLDPEGDLILAPPQNEAGCSTFGTLEGSVQTVAVQEPCHSNYDEATLEAPVVHTEIEEFNANDLINLEHILPQQSNEIFDIEPAFDNDLNEHSSNTEYVNNLNKYNDEYNRKDETFLDLLTSNKANDVEETQGILHFNENDDLGHDLQCIDPNDNEFTHDAVIKYMEDVIGHQSIPSVDELQIGSEVCLDPEGDLILAPPQNEAGCSTFGTLEGSLQTVAVQEPCHSNYDEATLEAPVVHTEIEEFNANDLINLDDLLPQQSKEIFDIESAFDNDEYNMNNEMFLDLLTSNKANDVEETQGILHLNENDVFGHDLQCIDPSDIEFTQDGVIKHMEDVLDDTPLAPYAHTPKLLKKKIYLCNLCGKTFTNLTKRQKHTKTEHNKSQTRHSTDKDAELFTCDYCKQTFSCREPLISHIQEHANIHERKYKCDFCARTYETDILMRCHVTKKHGMLHGMKNEESKEDSEEEVKVEYEDVKTGTEHKILVLQLEKIYDCDLCGAAFMNLAKYRMHMKSEHNIEGEGKVCKKEKISKDEVYDDINTVTENKKKQVQLRTANKMAINIIRALYKNEKIIKKDCAMCHKHFNRTSDFKRHIVQHIVQETCPTTENDETSPIFHCQLCNEGRICSVNKFKAHLHKHLVLRIYQCDFCEKTFNDSSNYCKHKKIHSSDVFQCDICKRKFNTKKMISQHMEHHNKTNALNCEECGKVFYFMSNLKKHFNSNHKMNVKKYSCQICQMKFESMKLKWDHQWKEHSLRKNIIDCSACHAMFRTFSELKRHCKVVHGFSMPYRKRV